MLNFLHEREGKTTIVYYVLKMSVFVQQETVYVKTTVQKVSISYRQRHARCSYSAYDEKLKKCYIRF